MISNNGKIHIKRYLAGYVPAIGHSIAFGVSSGTENTTDQKLQFESGRTDVSLTSYDFINDKIIFKAPIPDDYIGKIYEVALYSTSAAAASAEFGSRLLASFDSDTEGWVDGGTGVGSAYFPENSRIGADSLRQAPVASTGKTDTSGSLVLDLSGYSGADRFVFAFHNTNTNVANIKFRFLTDTSNHYEFTVTSPGTGYQIVEIPKSSAIVTGSPDWGSITQIRVTTTATAAGAAQVDFDGIRVEDTDTINPDYVMISREVLATPFEKKIGMTQEIEFGLKVNI